MHRSRSMSTFVATLGLLTACTTMSYLPQAESESAQLYMQRCGACHAAAHPGRHPYTQWQAVISMMETRMSEYGMAPLSEADRNTILTYLEENSK